MPPLRDRKADIVELVEHFLHKKAAEVRRPVKTVSGAAMRALTHYSWPGNVRELENVIERAVVLSDGDELDWVDLPMEPPPETQAPSELGATTLTQKLEDLERSLIVDAMTEAEGVKTRAAEILGVKTSALYYKLEKYGLADSIG